jgi:cell division protein FtsL
MLWWGKKWDDIEKPHENNRSQRERNGKGARKMNTTPRRTPTQTIMTMTLGKTVLAVVIIVTITLLICSIFIGCAAKTERNSPEKWQQQQAEADKEIDKILNEEVKEEQE